MIDFNKYKEEFLKKVGSYENWCIPDAYGRVGYPANSIFWTEALVLYSLSQEYNIDCFIESGVYRGGSTSLWCRVFKEKTLFSVDYVEEGLNPKKKWKAVSETLSSMYYNITFIRGNGNEILPKVISENKDKKFGVFVDGPKDKEGINLMEKCFSYENVCFSSLHDYTHKNYFSTTNNDQLKKLSKEMNSAHPQFEKYPVGPGLVVIDKENILK